MQNTFLLCLCLEMFSNYKPNDCCLRNTMSCWLTPNSALKIAACVFLVVIINGTAKIF